MRVEKESGESEAWCDGLKTFVDHHVLSVPDLRHWCSCPLCPEASSEAEDDGDYPGGWAEGAYDKDDEGDEGDEGEHAQDDGAIAIYVV